MRSEANHTGSEAVVGFAEELGKLLGAARAKADNWLGQRSENEQTPG